MENASKLSAKPRSSQSGHIVKSGPKKLFFDVQQKSKHARVSQSDKSFKQYTPFEYLNYALKVSSSKEQYLNSLK